ncbi:hypothetical protein RUM44_001230 [Polyplax serrata]|uniref:Uncharacterized protein n=1 Tax=Polyplax serrata TaxID=468196 RepID=A0ABR1AL60_POLSC
MVKETSHPVTRSNLRIHSETTTGESKKETSSHSVARHSSDSPVVSSFPASPHLRTTWPDNRREQKTTPCSVSTFPAGAFGTGTSLAEVETRNFPNGKTGETPVTVIKSGVETNRTVVFSADARKGGCVTEVTGEVPDVV